MPEEIPERIGIGYLDIEEAVDAARKIRPATSGFKQTTVHSPALDKPRATEQDKEGESAEIEVDEMSAEIFEGRADEEFDISETGTYQNTFHRIASDITGAFEGGKTGTLNLVDLGIISYGKHQATLHSGTLLGILNKFTELSSSATAKKMETYLDRVKSRDASLREDSAFIQLLKNAAAEPEMNQAQDEEFDRQYWQPAKRRAAKHKVKTALGHAIFYDTTIQGSVDRIATSTVAKLGGTVGSVVNGKEISELELLRAFVDERIQLNLAFSAYQQSKSDELNKAAQELEDQAAGDPAKAVELKSEAAKKRSLAKQFAANSYGLKVSSTKTRGPSFVGLVESGDLDLMDGDAGKIYLKGKPGVVIASLQPGATIDLTESTGKGDTDEVAAEVERPADIDEAADEVKRQEGDDEVATEVERQADFDEAAIELTTQEDTDEAAPFSFEMNYQAAPSEMARPAGSAWVELADQVVAESDEGQSSVRVLYEMFGRSDDLEDLATVATGDLPSAAQIFDSIVYSGNPALRQQLAENFQVVALPGESARGKVCAGDVIVRRSWDGPTAHVASIASPGLMNREALQSEGMISESNSPGHYVQVIEGGRYSHEREDNICAPTNGFLRPHSE